MRMGVSFNLSTVYISHRNLIRRIQVYKPQCGEKSNLTGAALLLFFTMFGPAFRAFCILGLSSFVWAQSSPGLAFHVLGGGNDNYFYRDNITSAQLLVTAANNTNSVRRIVVALPAGNSGGVAYFLPVVNTETLGLSLVDGSFKTTTEAYNNIGAQADMTFTGNAQLGVTIIGAVRALRDYVEGSGTMHEIFNYTLSDYNLTSVRLHRQNINQTVDSTTGQMSYKGADLYLSIPTGSDAQLSVIPSTNGTYTPPDIKILVPSGATNPVVRMRVLTNETTPLGLDAQELFLQDSEATTPAIQTALQGLNDGSNIAATQVSFLTYRDKFTAGGWRFLTYFGRDSMIALRLLMPLLSPDAIEAALGAVIERANSTGALCHEETVGDYASFININNGDYGYGAKPFYDYKMVDTDLFLLPALSHYFLDLPQGKGRAAAFMAKQATLQNGTYADIVKRISDYNFERAIPFYQKPIYSNLVALRTGVPVGNWRDSDQGLGYGRIPFDVNSALVPASLRGAEGLIDAGILEKPSANVHGKPLTVGALATFWETRAYKFFQVSVDPSTAESRLEDFVHKDGLSDALLSGGQPKSAVKFFGLSLKADGTPVEVMNSDIGFNLLYGSNVSRDFLQLAVNALTSYPRGLLTNVGMVVANPAYDGNRTNIDILNRGAYHGTVIWSFQQAVMASGLARQLSFCSPNSTVNVDFYTPPASTPAWCKDARFVQSIKDAQARMWDVIRGGRSEIYSELWSYSFDNKTNQFSVEDLAALSPTGTESDAIQLWSYGFLGLLDPSGNKVGPTA
ncbi:hypothetical protein AX17_007110 [Amanita inopinata Kibby_2008]|nr:hypothetical protein AX17_007110 [Amanita inopinata Kibby_2008]